jgi:putative oxidoreductase
MKLLTATNTRLLNLSILLLRCTVGFILFVAGAGKLFSWFGGFGMKTTIQYYSLSGISEFFTYVSAYTEFIGGLLLIIGLLTRPAAFAVLINMIVATYVMWPKGFVTGAAYPFSLTISALVILLTGPMTYSIDALLTQQGRISDNVKKADITVKERRRVATRESTWQR